MDSDMSMPAGQMDHGAMGKGTMESMMESDDMNVGTIDVFHFPVLYWSFVAAVIATATLVNIIYKVLCWQRLSAARRGQPAPAKPKFAPVRWFATLTAIAREISYASAPLFSIRGYTVRQPTLGGALLISANATLLIILGFYRIDASDLWQFENIGYRLGFLAICQLPLVFLLSSKNNVIGWLTGMSYEKLNWIHRWVARCLLLSVTMHGAYFLADWAPFDYMGHMVTTDAITKKGIAAWAILVWIALSSMSPIRGWNYEFFVIQHLISLVAFVVVVYLHTPDEVHMWVWFTVAVFVFDRLFRVLFVVYNNLSFLHPRQRKSGTEHGILACRADLTPMPCGVTRVTINDPPISWQPGQHVLLACHSVVPLQSHPFTVYSLPSDGKMQFLIKAHRGGTRRFLTYAQKHFGLPSLTRQPFERTTMAVTVDGPYGRMRPLRQFDSVILIAGSTGATFTLPLLREVVQRWQEQPNNSESMFHKVSGAVTRRIRFVWVIKSSDQISWFSKELSSAVEDTRALFASGYDVDVAISIYVTCDNEFTSEDIETVSSSAAAKTSYDSYDVEKQTMEKAPLKKEPDDFIEVQEVDPRSESSNFKGGCQPDGSCCCKATIEDEADEGASQVVCNCNCSKVPVPSSKLDSTDSGKSTREPVLHPGIKVFSGRPKLRNIILRNLEQALGESAVVVCGPSGLVNDVRRSNVALSDGRAVHKGTGAQGIYLHTEAFSY